MATYRITTKTGESYKIESPNELSNEELAWYAENPLGEQSKPEPVAPSAPTFAQKEEQRINTDSADLGGLYKRSVDRGQSVYAPTKIGNYFGQEPGTIGEAIAGTPERALRLGAATVGTAADVVNTGLKIATRGLVGEKPGEVAIAAVQKTGLPELVAPAVKKYNEFEASLDPAAKANWGAAKSGINALATFGGIKTGEGVVKKVIGDGSLLKEVGPRGVVKALAEPLKNEVGAISPQKAMTSIPDIDNVDDILKVEEAAKLATELPKNLKQIKKNIGQPPKGGFKNYSLSTAERGFLSTPDLPGETPMPQVMQQAQEAVDKRFEGVLTPWDKAAADKGGEALRLISSKKNEIGKIKGDLVDAADDYLIATNQFADATPIQQRFVELVRDRLGGQFDANGRLVDGAGRILNEFAGRSMILKMARTVDKIGKNSTLKQLDDAVMDLRSMVEDKKSSQTKQIFTKVDGLGSDIRGDIKNLVDDYLENSVNWGGADDFLGKEGVATLKGALSDYANIAKIEDRLNRGFGEVVDPVTGQMKMGSSLMKSALMSSSDRGSKALFRVVRDLTGIDLMREAAKAEIAMTAVGDPRATDLLKEVGSIGALASGSKTKMAVEAAKKVASIYTGEKPDQVLRFYAKYNPDVKMEVPVIKKDVYRTYQRPEKKTETIGDVVGGRTTGLVRVESKPVPRNYTETNYPKREKTIGEVVSNKSAPEEVSDPFERSLLTPKEYKEREAAKKLQALQGEGPLDYNPEELLTPEEYAQKRHFDEMDKAYRGKDSGPQVRDESNSVKVGIRKSLGLPGSREIRMENLSPKKQAEINKYAADITNEPMMREVFRDAGLIDANTDKVHPDDVVKWMNEAQKEKGQTIGDVFKKTLGNERGAVGTDRVSLSAPKKTGYKAEYKSAIDQLTENNKDYSDIEISDVPQRGFLLPDGDYLAIGGGNDHRHITGKVSFEKNYEDAFHSGSGPGLTDKMYRIMNESGAIRFIPESNVFQIIKEPSRSQVRSIGKYIEENGSAEVEFGVNGRSNVYTTENMFDLEDDVSNYTNKYVTPMPKPKPETIGSALKNERGSVGSENPQIHTENFKNWFGDWKNKPEQASKVVDEKGNPVRVFRGDGLNPYSSSENYTTFDMSKAGSGTGAKSAKEAIFFSKNPKTAEFYSGYKEKDPEAGSFDLFSEEKEPFVPNAPENSRMSAHYLNMKRPLVVDFKGEGYGSESYYDLIKKAKKYKNDGVIIKNTTDGGPVDDIYAVFHPNQIKSATGNSGAFSKSTNDIRGSSALKTMAATGATAAGALTIGEALKAKKKK